MDMTSKETDSTGDNGVHSDNVVLIRGEKVKIARGSVFKDMHWRRPSKTLRTMSATPEDS
jgi:hypothetical protein